MTSPFLEPRGAPALRRRRRRRSSALENATGSTVASAASPARAAAARGGGGCRRSLGISGGAGVAPPPPPQGVSDRATRPRPSTREPRAGTLRRFRLRHLSRGGLRARLPCSGTAGDDAAACLASSRGLMSVREHGLDPRHRFLDLPLPIQPRETHAVATRARLLGQEHVALSVQNEPELMKVFEALASEFVSSRAKHGRDWLRHCKVMLGVVEFLKTGAARRGKRARDAGEAARRIGPRTRGPAVAEPQHRAQHRGRRKLFDFREQTALILKSESPASGAPA